MYSILKSTIVCNRFKLNFLVFFNDKCTIMNNITIYRIWISYNKITSF